MALSLNMLLLEHCTRKGLSPQPYRSMSVMTCVDCRLRKAAFTEMAFSTS
jgi:hypothetical protein